MVVEKPDGWWGWAIVVAAFMNLALTDGVFVSMSLLTLELIDLFEEPVSKVAWVSSIFCGFLLVSAPLATGLANKFGYRIVIIVGALVGSFGFAISSVVPSVDYLMVTIGVIAGLGFGLVYTPAIAAVSFYFNKRRALATGLAFCGSGIGMFAFPHLTNLLLSIYGLRSTLFLLGGIYLNCIVFGALYRPVLLPDPAESTESNDPEVQPLKSPIESPDSKAKEVGIVEQMFRPSLFRSYAFILVNISTLISSLGYMIPFTFLAAHAEGLGFSRDEAAFLVSIIGITTCVGPVVGLIIDHPKVSALWVNNIAMTICGVLTIILPFLPSYELLVAYAAAFGLTISCLMPTRPILMADMVGLENMSSAFGYMMLFFGVTVFFGNPLAGAFYDATGSFDSSFYLAGSLILVAGLLCYPLGCLNRWQKNRGNKPTFEMTKR